jgi:Transposase, Mutator family
VRRAKDKHHVPKRYYRPEQVSCPQCGQVLKRCYAVGRKYIVFLSGRHLVVSMGYRCATPHCTGRHRVHVSQVARRLTVRGSSFALEVIGQIGYWRFWKRWTVAQIHAVLTQERHLPISEREVLYLIGVFLVLLRCTYPLRLHARAAYFRRQGLFLAIDALKPEKGNTALYVVRELKFGLVLHVVPLLSADHLTLEGCVLKPLKALGYRMRGVVSDDEKALQIAVAQVFPGVPHQTCQVHCLRDAAAPIAAADGAYKKALKQAIRGPFYAAQRALHRLNPTDPRQVVLSTYADLIRSTLTEGSKPPFALGGLRVFEDLARLDASLRRSRKKGAIRS